MGTGFCSQCKKPSLVLKHMHDGIRFAFEKVHWLLKEAYLGAGSPKWNEILKMHWGVRKGISRY